MANDKNVEGRKSASDQTRKHIILDEASQMVKRLSDDDKKTVSFFFSKFGASVSVSEGRLYTVNEDIQNVLDVLRWFKIWCITEARESRRDNVVYITCNTTLLVDVAWFSLPYLNLVEGELEIPDQENNLDLDWKLQIARRFTNAFRWFIVLSLQYFSQPVAKEGNEEEAINE